MVSVNLPKANLALSTDLRRIDTDLTIARRRIASGLKVASARDDAGIWTTATSMRADIATGAVAADNIAKAKAQAQAAFAGLTTVLDALDKIKTLTADLKAGSAANADTQKTLANYQSQLRFATNEASVNGVNLLTAVGVEDFSNLVPSVTFPITIGWSANAPVTYDFTARKVLGRNGDLGLLAPGSTSYDNLYKAVFSVSSTQANIDTYVAAVNTATGTIRSYANELSAFIDGLDTMRALMARNDNIRAATLGSLVDANLEVEAAKTKALGVRQQLSYQTISIGNRLSRNVLRLFS